MPKNDRTVSCNSINVSEELVLWRKKVRFWRQLFQRQQSIRTDGQLNCLKGGKRTRQHAFFSRIQQRSTNGG